MTPATRKRGEGELLAIVKDAQRPTLQQRGRLLFANDIADLFQGRKSRWWVNNRFLQEKKLKVGRDNAWWEADVLRAIDDGDVSG